MDLTRKQIHLRDTKSGRPRWIPISGDLLAILKALPRHVKTNRVFTYYGKPTKTLQGSWEGTRDDAALADARFHDLRHTWASRMVERGMDLYTPMEIGGWRSVSMVQRYAHFAPEHKLKMAQLVNGTAGTSTVPTEPPKLVARLVARKVG